MSRWKRVSVAIVLAVFGFVGFGSWALASPVGSSPDDDYHLISIWCSWGERDGLCEPGNAENERSVSLRLIQSADCYARDSTKTAECAIEDEFASTSRGNFANNYPPVYYKAMGAFASENVEASTVAIRLANAGIFVGAVSLLLVLLRPGQRGPLFWSVVVGLIPLGMFIVPSMNPSSWAVLAGLTVWVALTGYFTATSVGRRVGLGAFAFVAALMGAGARGDAGAYMIISAGTASILTFTVDKRWFRLLLLPFAIAVMGAYFFLTTGQSTSYASNAVARADTAAEGAATATVETVQTWPLVVENLMQIPSLWAGSLGTWGLGWLEWGLPQTIAVIMVGAFSALAFRGLRVLNWRKGITLGLLLLALIVIPSYILYGIGTMVGSEVQPRYLLPLVLISAGVALYGFRRDDLGLTKVQALVLLIGVSYANSLALFKTFRRYLSGTDYPGLNLNSNISWWWVDPVPSLLVSPMLVWFIGSIAFGLALLGGYFLLRNGATDDSMVVAPDKDSTRDPMALGEHLPVTGPATNELAEKQI